MGGVRFVRVRSVPRWKVFGLRVNGFRVLAAFSFGLAFGVGSKSVGCR
ncbi:hypothetical protein A2U01_0081851, partial [Trifolium medium]|nr:hypothetical protein [Trifolium medium]